MPGGAAPRDGETHCAGHGNIRERAGHRITRPPHAFMLDVRRPTLGHVGELEIVHAQVEEFLARQREAECVRALPLPAVAARAAAAFAPARDGVTFDEFAVARKHMVVDAPGPCWKRGSSRPAAGMLTLPPSRMAEMSRVPVLSLPARCTNASAPQKPLAVLETLAARIDTPDRGSAWTSPLRDQPACFTRMYHSTRRRTWRSV